MSMPDAPLAPVGLFDDGVDRARDPGDEPHGDQPPLGVAADRMLDLDHVGSPVGEHRSGRRHEGPGRDLEYVETGQCLAMWAIPLDETLRAVTMAAPPVDLRTR